MPITIGPFTVKNKTKVHIIEDILACFMFEEDVPCQHDPIKIIQEKRKKLKRGKYDHKGTSEMEKLANKFTFSDMEEDLDEVEVIETTTLNKVEENGKRPLEQDFHNGVQKRKRQKNLNWPKNMFYKLLNIQHQILW